ncbi:MAG: hypothetical protein ACTSQJ_12695 [Promethearchaeota archaeon]
MPYGLIVMKWNEKCGFDIEAKYPPDKDFNISDKTLLHVLSLHAFSKEGGIANLTVEPVNIATYYSGSDIGYYIILILNILENPEDYEKELIKISHKILDHLENKKYKEFIPTLYKDIVEYSKEMQGNLKNLL